MVEDERRQRIVERIQEDERLRGDLEDEAANALLSWASARAGAAAADPSRPDAAVEADVQAVRAATRAAARAGESDPRRLIAVAEAELSRSRALDSAAARPPGRALDPSAAAAPDEEPSAERTASQASSSRSFGDSRRKRHRLNAYLKRASRNR